MLSLKLSFVTFMGCFKRPTWWKAIKSRPKKANPPSAFVIFDSFQNSRVAIIINLTLCSVNWDIEEKMYMISILKTCELNVFCHILRHMTWKPLSRNDTYTQALLIIFAFIFFSNFLFSVSVLARSQSYTDRSQAHQHRVHCVLISNVIPNYLSSTAISSFFTSSLSIISSLSLASSKCLYGFWIYSDICFGYPHSWWEGICPAYMYVCAHVFVQVNLFALRTRGVFWWTLSHPEQKRQQVSSSAACFLTNPHLPKVQHSPPASQAYVFSCFWSVLIWSSLIFPPGLPHCSTSADPMEAIFQPEVHFPVASTCTVGGGGGGGLGACSYLH